MIDTWTRWSHAELVRDYIITVSGSRIHLALSSQQSPALPAISTIRGSHAGVKMIPGQESPEIRVTGAEWPVCHTCDM